MTDLPIPIKEAYAVCKFFQMMTDSRDYSVIPPEEVKCHLLALEARISDIVERNYGNETTLPNS